MAAGRGHPEEGPGPVEAGSTSADDVNIPPEVAAEFSKAVARLLGSDGLAQLNRSSPKLQQALDRIAEALGNASSPGSRAAGVDPAALSRLRSLLGERPTAEPIRLDARMFRNTLYHEIHALRAELEQLRSGRTERRVLRQPVPIAEAGRQLAIKNLLRTLRNADSQIDEAAHPKTVDLSDLLRVVDPRRRSSVKKWANAKFPPLPQDE